MSSLPEGTRPRSPWYAVNLSFTWPGLGQLWAGHRVAGGVLIAGYVLLATAAFVAAAWWPPSFALFVACAAGAIAIALGGLAHAYFMDRGRPVVLADELAPAGTDAWLVVLLSRLWPGLGHLAQGQWLPGIAFALGTLVVASVLVRLPALLGNLLYAAYGIVPAVLAYRGSPSRREVNAGPIRRLAQLAVVVPLLAGVLSMAVKAVALRAYRVPSESMSPTLKLDDRMFASRWPSGPPARGDVVVMLGPSPPTASFVRRVIALPGETVEIQDKVVFIDGRALAESYAVHGDPKVQPGEVSPRDNLRPLRVPEGCVFVLGDNRDNSNDSRFWGPVASSSLRGRVTLRYWPLARAGPVR